MSRLILRAAALLAAAALLYALQRTTPGYTEITGPIVQKASFGKVEIARSFRLRAEKVILADRLRWQSFGRSYERDTGGRWAVVVAAAEGTPETMTLTGVAWRSASGLRFEPSPRVPLFGALLNGNRLEPGLARRGLVIFEIGRDEAQGAVLQVSEARWPRLDTQLQLPGPQDAIEQAGTLDLDHLL